MNKNLQKSSVDKLIAFLLLCTPVLFGHAQEYFQQEVNYKIDVTLDDEKHELIAVESFEYINNSPDELTFIWMHIWPNAYKDNSSAMAKQLLEMKQTNFYFADDEDRGYIDGLAFKVNNKEVVWEKHPEHIDVGKIILNEPLKPGGKIQVTTPFHVKIPKGVYSRLGHIDQQYQITQWYPKPAVYDRNGWHEMPYLSMGEFYSEYGSFDVSITLPKNYVVGATGDLQNQNEAKWLNALAEKTALIPRDQFDTEDDQFPKSAEETKTLRFIQKNVHDFAWFADKRYHVLKGQVELPNSGRKVTTWAMFTNGEADLWRNAIEYLNDATYYYSLWNGDYPYNHVTAVDGALSAGGGMEYPNITVIGHSGSWTALETTIMHEVGHNWFYGILGSNERDHPWMDEGINSFNENRYMETKYPGLNYLSGQVGGNKLMELFDLEDFSHKRLYYEGYLINARRNMDQPIEHHSTDYTMINYGAIVYGKTALVLDYLLAYLGEETFDKCMQTYYNRWKFKHPQPEDLQAIFKEVTGKDLTWFWEGMIHSTQRVDYKIVSDKKGSCPTSFTGHCQKLTIKNTGDLAAPFSISVINADTVTSTKWFEGFEGKKELDIYTMDYDQLRIDGTRDIPEINRRNNTIRSKGLFKKVEPLRLQWLGSIENPNKSQLFYTPVIGWNNYDKFMLGMALYNNVVPQKNFQYVLAPMYGFESGAPVGLGSIDYNIFTKGNIFQNITIGVAGSRFSTGDPSSVEANYLRIVPHIDFELKRKVANSSVKQVLSLRSVNITENSKLNCDTCLNISNQLMFNEVSYTLANNKALNPIDFTTTVQQNDQFLQASAELNYRMRFKKPGKFFHARLFAGKYIYNNSNNPRYNWRMDGQSGIYDYTYDHLFLGRTEGTDDVMSHQFTDNHGGFKTPTGVGQSHDWLVAMNLKGDFPIPPPLGGFIDIGYNEGGALVYDAGLYASFARNVFEIYFPLTYSQNIINYFDANGITFYERIRFTLHLNKLNPFKLLKDFEL